MGTLSPIHWILAAIVVLLVFGPKALSRVGRTAGKGVRTFNNAKKSLIEAPKRIIDDPPKSVEPSRDQNA
jgi:TatA/E family protein of Tat protein translocase